MLRGLLRGVGAGRADSEESVEELGLVDLVLRSSSRIWGMGADVEACFEDLRIGGLILRNVWRI